MAIGPLLLSIIKSPGTHTLFRGILFIGLLEVSKATVKGLLTTLAIHLKVFIQD